MINASQLTEWHGMAPPHTIAKTQITVDKSDKWFIYLEDNGQRSLLASWKDERVCRSSAVDLVAILGHRLTVMPWQKVIFKTDSICCNYLTFLEQSS